MQSKNPTKPNFHMSWLYTLLEPASTENRLALLIAAFRVIGILGFALLSACFVVEDAYLEATISVVLVLAWIAATTEAIDLALERYW